MIDKAKLPEWARLAKMATAGPLILIRYEHGGGRLFKENEEIARDRNLVADFYAEADREFYAASREAVPALIEALVEERAHRNLRTEELEDRLVLEGIQHIPKDTFNDPIEQKERAIEIRRARRELGLEDA